MTSATITVRILSLDESVVSTQEHTFNVEKVIGYGGYGKVFKCQWRGKAPLPNDPLCMAGKELNNPVPATEYEEGESRNTLRRLQSLQHENVLKTFHIGFESPAMANHSTQHPNSCWTVWIFQELCDGSLHDLLLKQALASRIVLNYTLQLLQGLDYLHGAKAIHTDLKGQNILLTQNNRLIKIGDLDNYVRLRGTRTCSDDVTKVMGTEHFMSPEMTLQGFVDGKSEKIGRRTDIWSVGCLVLEMISQCRWTIGLKPAAGWKRDTLMQFYETHPEGSPDIPKNIRGKCNDLLKLCFRRDPQQRPEAAALIALLTPYNNTDLDWTRV
ncbi:putative Mitogen-activated protein kinase kinase kinase 4 [Hypsibius exemplaris]|uniref:Mitogen-activated protein kinase kinase kinase 4 n=1 Tax=Hypsibius exemplaris TaxID=2072580 RepID=A0A1W0X9Q2_HYPEX|nr:putative Mitogen-activated protein kinase kinase kinase 4 [Hypsibius exemplaris]